MFNLPTIGVTLALLALLALLAWVVWYFRQQARVRALEADRIATISRIGMQITATLDLEQTFDRLYHRINQLMDAHTFGVGIYDAERQQIDFALAIEGGHRYKPYARDTRDKNQLAVWCIDNAQTLALNSFDEVSQYIDYQPEIEERQDLLESEDPTHRIESYIYVPIQLKDEVIGILSVQSFRPGAYKPVHVDMVQALSSYTAIAIDNARAHSRLAEALDRLQHTQQQLIVQETLASLGTLTAGVAHEINNPTNFLNVAAQNLESDLDEFTRFLIHLAGDNADEAVIRSLRIHTDNLGEHVKIVQEGAERITRIVADLRAFSRPQVNDEAQKVRLGAGLESTANLVKTNYVDEIQFELAIQDDPEVLAHPGQMNQVFMNLLVNACQAVQGHCPRGEGRVIIRSFMDGEHIVFQINDNGCGMPDSVRDRVFEPFYSTKPVGQGTGMGLSISYGIVEQHGGEIEVRSSPDDGSEFSVRLPVVN